MLVRYPLCRLGLAAAAAGVLLGAASAAQADDTAFFDMPAMPYGQHIVGAELILGSIEYPLFLDIGLQELTLVGLEGSVHWSLSDHLMLNGAVSLVTADSDSFDGTSLGNLTAGLTYGVGQSRTASGISGFALDASVSVPTADDSGEGRVAADIWGDFYVPDRGRYAPRTTTIRVAGEYRVVTGRAVLQLELGLHQRMIAEIDDITRVRLGAGVGLVASPQVFLLAELTTISDILDDNGYEEDFVHSLNLGTRIRTGGGNVGVRVYLPLDDSLRDNDIVGLTVQYQAYLD